MAGRRPPPRPARKPAAPAGAAHANGTVIAAFRRHWAVRTDEGVLVDCVLKGRSATIAAGDRVEIARFDDGGAILQVLPRRNLVYRSDAFKDKLIAANVTLVIGVVAPDLAVDLELVDRWSVAAEAEGCAFLLCANKADHPGFAAFLARLAPWQRLGYEVMPLSAKQDAGPLRARVLGEHSVLVGQSGMGKSTIVNALVPRARPAWARCRTRWAADATPPPRARCTSCPATRPAGGSSIRPGMTKFALAHLDPDAIPEAFVELRPFLGHCRFRDCRHDQEPGCAVRQAIERGDVAPHRVALMQAMVAESRAVRDPAR